MCVLLGETREGWPLLTAETEVNGDSKNTNERGFSLVAWFVVLVSPEKRFFCSALAALVGPVQNFFPHRTLFQSLLGMQPWWVAGLLVCVSGAAPDRRPAQL